MPDLHGIANHRPFSPPPTAGAREYRVPEVRRWIVGQIGGDPPDAIRAKMSLVEAAG
ncbi:MAG: hypothetical protein HY898_28190 [Deltaproteobacteria bacterium]|nr:hypothetical protein [Deltaproteobacteria bacterium]